MSRNIKIGKAGVLMLYRRLWSVLINFIVLAVVAREVSKFDFGIVAICSVLISFFSVLASFGVSEYIITNKLENSKFERNQLFTAYLLILIPCYISLFAFFFIWSNIYDERIVLEIGILLSFGFLGEMIGVIPKAILRRDLDYSKLIFILTIFGTVTAIIKVVLALAGFGIYSLVLPSSLIPLIQGLYFMRKTRLRLTFDLNTKIFVDLIKYSKPLLGSNILTFVVNEGDTIIVGKFLGFEALGIYNIAFNLSNVFQNNFLPIITDISLPIFSSISTSRHQLKSGYFKMVHIITFFSFIILSLMLTHSKLIFQLLYGLNWNDAIVPFQILILFTLFRSISSPTSGLLTATDNNKKSFYISLVFTPLFLFSVFFGSFYGVVGVCLGVAISRIAGSVVSIQITLKYIDSHIRELIERIWPIFASCVLHSFLCIIIQYVVGYSIISEFSIVIIQLIFTFFILKYFFKIYFIELFERLTSLYPRLAFIKNRII